MNEWKTVILSDIVDKVIDNRGKTPPTVLDGIELLEVNAIGKRSPDYTAVRKYVTEEVYENWFRSGHPKRGDILVPTVGTIGNVSIMTKNIGAIAQNVIALRFSKEAEPNFVYYYLCSNEGRCTLLSLDIGGVQPSIKVPHLLDMELPFPPLPEQCAIAAVLSSLDDKIDLLHRQNKTLEAMAETLFRQWFVEEAEEGWEEEKLENLLDFVVDNRGKTAPTEENGISLIATNCIKNSNIFPIYEKVRYVSAETKENWFRSNPIPWDIIFVNKGTPGCVNFVPDPVDFCIAQDMIALRVSKNKISNYYIFLFLRTPDVQNHIKNSSVGTTIPHLKKADLLNFIVPLPEKKKSDIFHEMVDPFFKKISNNSQQIRHLYSFRDTLLPKLMSGEIRVMGK